MDFAHLALDTHFSKKDDQTAAEAYIVKLCGGKPDILGGYFGTLLPCVCVDGKPVKSEGIGKGDSLHFYLQGIVIVQDILKMTLIAHICSMQVMCQ